MNLFRLPILAAFLSVASLALAAEPRLPGITAAVQRAIDAHDIAGAVTMVVTKDRVLDLETIGLADLATSRPMTADTMFNIMSMTKLLTATAVLMLQDDAKLSLSDPVAKFLPGFAALKTPSGRPAHLTIMQLMTHTSGLGEASGAGARDAKTLADLIPLFLAAPMQFEPGTQWKYCQSGINTAARLVEIASGQTFPEFLEARILGPLGLKHTTHYPTKAQLPLVATPYAKNFETGQLTAVAAPPPAPGTRPPFGNAAIFSTAPDYARFCQMLLNGGALAGHRYLSPAALRQMTTVQTGELSTGFFQAESFGRRGANYGWGVGTCILKAPHDGAAAMLSPGTYGHGGAWGTQAWIDPLKGVAYVLMVQRTNYPPGDNADNSAVRREFQQAAVAALSPL